MSLIMPKENEKDFELPPAGTHAATCYRVVDMGTQQGDWQGKPIRQHKIMLSWELTTEKMSDGRPFSVHKRYTLSSSKKATLRKDLEAWRGVPFSDEDFGTFDISKLLGKSCLLGIVHSTKESSTYANISSILKLPRGMQVEPLVNGQFQLDLSNFDQLAFDSLSEGIKAVIAKSPEYQELKGAKLIENNIADSHHISPDLDDSIPF